MGLSDNIQKEHHLFLEKEIAHSFNQVSFPKAIFFTFVMWKFESILYSYSQVYVEQI